MVFFFLFRHSKQFFPFIKGVRICWLFFFLYFIILRISTEEISFLRCLSLHLSIGSHFKVIWCFLLLRLFILPLTGCVFISIIICVWTINTENSQKLLKIFLSSPFGERRQLNFNFCAVCVRASVRPLRFFIFRWSKWVLFYFRFVCIRWYRFLSHLCRSSWLRFSRRRWGERKIHTN